MKVAFVLMGGNQTCKLCLMMESTIAGIKVRTSVPILCSDNVLCNTIKYRLHVWHEQCSVCPFEFPPSL